MEATPKYKLQTFLTTVVLVISEVNGEVKNASDAGRLPPGVAETYKAAFEKTSQELGELRDNMNKMTVDEPGLLPALEAADKKMEKANADLDVWRIFHSGYYPEKYEDNPKSVAPIVKKGAGVPSRRPKSTAPAKPKTPPSAPKK